MTSKEKKEYAISTEATPLHQSLVGNENPSDQYFSIDWGKLEDIWNAELPPLTAQNRSMLRRGGEEPPERKTSKEGEIKVHKESSSAQENFNKLEKAGTVKETQPLFSQSPKLPFSWDNIFSKPATQSLDRTSKSSEDPNGFNKNWNKIPKVQTNHKQEPVKDKTDHTQAYYKKQNTHKANKTKIATDQTHFPKHTKENRLVTDQNRKHKIGDNERMKEFSEIWQRLKNTFEDLPKSDSPRKRKAHQRPHTRPHSRRQ